MIQPITKSGALQGRGTAKKKKRKKLKFSGKENNKEIRKKLGEHYVRMPYYGYYFEKKEGGGTKWSNPISQTDLLLNLQDLGIDSCRSTIGDLLVSDAINEVTPLHFIHERILEKEWDGVDRISQFIDGSNLEGDRSTNEMIIRKWLLNTYSVAFKGIDPEITFKAMPRVVIIFHSNEKKLGKSSIMRKIGLEGFVSKAMPKLSQEVYSELQSGFKQDGREFLIMLASSLIINFDDVGEFFMNHPAELRALCTQTNVQIRPLRTDKLVSMPRIAGLCGTTNNPTALRSSDENRYAVFTLNPEGVKWDIMEGIDPLDLWRQARAEAIEAGFGVNWEDKETDEVIKISQNYLYKNPLEDFVDGHFVYDPEGEMKFADIKTTIREVGNIGETDKRIRHALDRLTPPRRKLKKTINGYSFYKLKEVFPAERKKLTVSSANASDVFDVLSGASEPSIAKVKMVNTLL